MLYFCDEASHASIWYLVLFIDVIYYLGNNV